MIYSFIIFSLKVFFFAKYIRFLWQILLFFYKNLDKMKAMKSFSDIRLSANVVASKKVAFRLFSLCWSLSLSWKKHGRIAMLPLCDQWNPIFLSILTVIKYQSLQFIFLPRKKRMPININPNQSYYKWWAAWRLQKVSQNIQRKMNFYQKQKQKQLVTHFYWNKLGRRLLKWKHKIIIHH